MTNAVLDVAIIGGGISGIYTAYRLKLHDANLKIAVFEGSDRIGGRLLSARSYFWPGATCELGGMRYIPGYHKRVTCLLSELQLASYDMPEIDQKNNIAFLRNRMLRICELGKPEMLPFNFYRDEKEWLKKEGAHPFSLVVRMLMRELPDLHEKIGKPDELRDYLQHAEIYGRPLIQWGFWNLLLRGISGEGYKAGRDTIGYDVLGLNYNAADMIAEIFQFGSSVAYKMLVNGYEALPYELRRRFTDCLGGEINFQHWLLGFDIDTDDNFLLTFKKTSGDGNGRNNETIDVKSKKIVLAMPKRSIELLLCDSPPLKNNVEFQKKLYTVAPVPLLKMFLIYKSPWWQKVQVTGGRSLTDLPMRQCYYWPFSTQSPEADSNGPGAIMVYNDELNVTFWGALERKVYVEGQVDDKDRQAAEKRLHPFDFARRNVSRKFASVSPQFASQPTFFHNPNFSLPEPPPSGLEKQLYKNWCERPAQDHHIQNVERQLLRMHGLDEREKSELLDATIQDWRDDPFGGGVHFWQPGWPSSIVSKSMIRPIDDMECYVCGEAYSTIQTWVEGALETADLVIEKLT